MKKIPLLLVLAALMWSCNQSATKKDSDASGANSQSKKEVVAESSEADVAKTRTLQKSLNGIDSSKAVKLIKKFDSVFLDHVVPEAKTSIWFRADIIKAMYNLLVSERHGKSSKSYGTPDGFRIYYISQTPDSTKLSIAVVSTKNNGNAGGFYLHKDYYYHDSSNSLYNLPNIEGERSTGSCKGGALLNDPCKANCADKCAISPSHDITRAEGENMTIRYGNDEINTRAVWFDFEMLESIIKSNVPFDGIRIYTSNYGITDALGAPVDPPATPALERKQKRDTFVLTLTKDSVILATNKHTQRDNFDCSTIEKVRNYYLTKGAGLNNGELCPNHCDK